MPSLARPARVSRPLAAALVAVLLASCGGGGSAVDGTPAPDTSSPATPGTPPAAVPPALVAPAPIAASDGTMSVAASYRPNVRALSTDATAPQLVAAGSDGTLSFDRPLDVAAGDVLLVGGKAYVVVSADATRQVLGTRAPALAEVFETLRVTGTVDAASAATAAPAGTATGGLRQRLSTATTTLAATQAAYPLPDIKAAIGVELTLSVTLDIDFTAANGFRRFDLKAAGQLAERIDVSFVPEAAGGGSTSGIEVVRWSIPVPQTAGALSIDVPLMVSAQYTGQAKVEIPLQSGSSSFEATAHLNTSTGAIETSGTYGGNSTAGAPALAQPLPASATSSLGMTAKVGPDVQLSLFRGSIVPATLGLRAVGGLTGTAKSSSNGQTCLGWKVDLKGEFSAELKATSSLKLTQTYATDAKVLGASDNLADCDTPPPPPPSPTPAPTPATPAGQVPVAAAETLLPTPTGSQPLPGYELRILENRQAGPDVYCAALTNTGGAFTSCSVAIEFGLFRTGSSTPVDVSDYTTFPYAIGPDSLCRFQAPTYFGTWVFPTFWNIPNLAGKIGETGVSYLSAWNSTQRAMYTITRGSGPGLTAVNPYAPQTLSIVCNGLFTDRSGQGSYYVRATRSYADFANFTDPNNTVHYFTWH